MEDKEGQEETDTMREKFAKGEARSGGSLRCGWGRTEGWGPSLVEGRPAPKRARLVKGGFWIWATLSSGFWPDS